MSSTLTERRFGVLTNLAEPSMDENSRRADFKNDHFPSQRPSLGERASRALARFLVTFCIGVAATLAWLSYGDAAREMIASSSPQLGWLAPHPAPAQTPPNVITPAAPVDPSLVQQQLNAISLGLGAVRQSVDQLAAQFTAGQAQMAQEITLLRAVEQQLVDKMSVPPPRPAAAPTRKPVPPTPTPTQQPPAPR
jgi:hypothetical protein